MRKLRKILAAILTVMMLCSNISISAFAAEDVEEAAIVSTEQEVQDVQMISEETEPVAEAVPTASSIEQQSVQEPVQEVVQEPAQEPEQTAEAGKNEVQGPVGNEDGETATIVETEESAMEPDAEVNEDNVEVTPVIEEEAEEEEVEKAPLIGNVSNEVYQKTNGQGAIEIFVKCNINVTNLSENISAQDVVIQGLLSENLSECVGISGGMSTYRSPLEMPNQDNADASDLRTFADGSAVYWDVQNIEPGQTETIAFTAKVTEDVTSVNDLTSAWYIDGVKIDASSINWRGTDKLVVEEERALKTDFFYEDNRVSITAIAKEEANLPENAELKATYLPEGSVHYNQAVAMIETQMSSADKEFIDFVCYDVYFEVDGVRIEPEAGTVNVTMKYKQPVFSDVEEEISDYATYHINGETSVVEDVTETIHTNSEGAVTSVGFTTESFSIIVNAALTSPTDFQTMEKLYYGDYGLTESDSTSRMTNKFTVTIEYKDEETGEVLYTVEDKVAYCLQADLGTPIVADDGSGRPYGGDYTVLNNSENLEKVLYYGYDGAGDLSDDFLEAKEALIRTYLGDSVYERLVTDRTYKENFFYIVTHVAASYEYYTSLNDSEAESKSYIGIDSEPKVVVEEWHDYLVAQQDYGLRLWKDDQEVTSIDVNVSTEATYRLTGYPETNKITFTVPTGIECTVTRNGQSQTYGAGATINIYPGSTFKFSAIAQYTTTTGSIKVQHEEFVAADISSNLQAVAVQYDYELRGWGGPGQDVGALYGVMAYNLEADEAAFKVVKTDDNHQPIANVEFKVYNSAGKYLRMIKTDNNGIAYLGMIISTDIPKDSNGDYKVYLEEITPDKYFDNSGRIEVQLNPSSPNEALNVVEVPVVNKIFKANLNIVKTDETGTKALEGAVFTVEGDNGYKNENVVSGENGSATLTGLEAGTYTVTETKAPKGYILNSEPQIITIAKKDGDTGETIPTFVVNMTNNAVTGKLSIEKVGDSLDSVTGEAGKKVFSYSEANLEGAVFKLYDTSNNVITTLTTDEKGMASIDKLPLGTYYLEEIQAPTGYVITEARTEIKLEYADQNTSVVSVDLTGESAIKNTRQKVRIDVRKCDENNNTIALAGAEFELYAAEDIVINDQIAVAKDTKIGVAISGEDGVATFSQDLPHGKYYVKETKAPMGYAVSDVPLYYDTMQDMAESEKGNAQVTICKDFTDCKLVLKVNKSDMKGTNWIAGAEITLKAAEDVIDAEGNKVYSSGQSIAAWVSDGQEDHDFGAVLIGGYTYELVETQAPIGYAYTESIEFTISTDGKVIVDESVVSTEGTILLKDRALSLNVNKVDASDNAKELDGAELTIFGKDVNGNYTVAIDSWISKKGEIHDFGSKLEVGKDYILRETKAPKGYQYAADIYFTIEKDGTIITDAKKIVDESGRTIYLMEDKEIVAGVKTEDYSFIYLYGVLMVISGVLLLGAVYRRRKNN